MKGGVEMYRSDKNKISEEFVQEDIEFLHKEDILRIFTYGQSKTMRLLKSGKIPLVWVGTDCIISKRDFKKWYKESIGQEIKIPETTARKI